MRAWWLAALAGVLLPACAHLTERGAVDVARQAGAEHTPDFAFGYQVVVTTATTRYRGELLACDPRAYVLLLNVAPSDPAPYVQVPARDVEAIDVPDPGHRQLRALLWTIAGTASTASHGRLFVFSAPTWATVGSVATVSAGSDGHHGCDELRGFARFPQGLPPAMRARPGFPAAMP